MYALGATSAVACKDINCVIMHVHIYINPMNPKHINEHCMRMYILP